MLPGRASLFQVLLNKLSDAYVRLTPLEIAVHHRLSIVVYLVLVMSVVRVHYLLEHGVVILVHLNPGAGVLRLKHLLL